VAGGAFDAKIRHADAAISANYADILVLSARQVMVAIEITTSKSGSGSYNTEDIYVFMKRFRRTATLTQSMSSFPAGL